MRSRLISFHLLYVSISSCVTVNIYHTTITSKTKIELPPFHISCKLNDIAIITSPAIREKNAHYYMNKPNGEVIKLDIFDFRSDNLSNTTNYSTISNDATEPVKYKLFNLNYGKPNDTNDVFEENRKQMDSMDFMIGPLAEEDHGNWVLSIFYTDSDGECTELFQVISVIITEKVPVYPSYPRLSEGSTFKLSFAYPIKYLETCELRPPKTTSDRFYDRNRTKLEFCEYIVPNVTKDDEGFWTIIGVGRTVYEANVYLKIDKINL